MVQDKTGVYCFASPQTKNHKKVIMENVSYFILYLKKIAIFAGSGGHLKADSAR